LQENEADKEEEKITDFKKEELCLNISFVSKMDRGDLKTMTGDLIKEKAGLESGNEWKL